MWIMALFHTVKLIKDIHFNTLQLSVVTYNISLIIDYHKCCLIFFFITFHCLNI